jgi:hypothetical protein
MGDWYGPTSLRPRANNVAPGVHPLGDLVVFARRLAIGRLLGRDELRLEQRDVLRIVILDDVQRASIVFEAAC